MSLKENIKIMREYKWILALTEYVCMYVCNHISKGSVSSMDNCLWKSICFMKCMGVVEEHDGLQIPPNFERKPGLLSIRVRGSDFSIVWRNHLTLQIPPNEVI